MYFSVGTVNEKLLLHVLIYVVWCHTWDEVLVLQWAKQHRDFLQILQCCFCIFQHDSLFSLLKETVCEPRIIKFFTVKQKST